MAFSHGVVSGTDIPVEHLDYGYIGKCEKASEVEALLKILRSNKEGYYPDLIKFTETRLMELNPKSKLLIKTEKARRLQDLPTKDSRGIVAEMEQWEQAVRGEEARLSSQDTVLVNGEDGALPPIRKTEGEKMEMSSKKTGGVASTGSAAQRIQSSDYNAWDKYNVERECAKVEEERVEATVEGKGGVSKDIGKLSEKELGLSAIEREKLALREKEKGNEAFRSGDYEEALAYYSRSIILSPGAPSHNNRAIALIKLQRHQEAIQDCNTVLQLEPSNTKALLRRGMAEASLNEWGKAEQDMEQLLKLEPKNKKAQEMLKLAREELSKSAGAVPKRKGRKVQIEEVEEEEEEESAAAPVSAPDSEVELVQTTPMPAEVVKLKERGNELFRRGQYGEAVAEYSKAIQQLETAGKGHESSLSTLLNNRAACQLKNGNSQACVADCTLSLQLVPVNIKALIRRAQAYEFMEKYRLAYVDNQLALSLDRNMPTVYSANSRISQLLKELDGNSWREKLPQHPDQLRVCTALGRSADDRIDGGSSSTVSPSRGEGRAAPTTGAGENCRRAGVTAGPTSRTDGEIRRAGDTAGPTSRTDGENSSSAGDTAGLTSRTDGENSRAGDTAGLTSRTDGENSSSAGDIVSPTTRTNWEDSGDTAGPTSSTDRENNRRAGDTAGPATDTGTTSTAQPATPTTRKQSATKQSFTASTNKPATRVTQQETTPITTPTSFSPSQAPPQPTDTVKFESAKAKGNEQVKKGRYLEALHCYSLCILACPDRVVGYTNRALCHLKLDAPAKAVEDCSKALELDPLNIKALYRRALARKGMKKFSESMKDLKQLLERDQENSAAQSEYTEVKQLWEKQLRQLQATNQKQREKKAAHSSKKKSPKNKAAKEKDKPMQQKELQKLLTETKNKMKKLNEEVQDASGFTESPLDYLTANKTTYFKGGTGEAQTAGKSRRKVVVEEEEGRSEEGMEGEVAAKEGRNVEVKPPASPTGVRESDKVVESSGDHKLTPYEFVQRWTSLARNGSAKEYASLLQSVPPGKLPDIVHNQLDGAMLSGTIRAISQEFLPQKQYQRSAEILENLCKVPRFRTIAMFLEKQEKKELGSVLSAIEESASVSKAAVAKLRRDYGLST